MTRINAMIDPAELCDQHLLAEHREIKRIPNLIMMGKLSEKGQPEYFTLGTGHMKFFRNKLYYLEYRYCEIYKECKRRGFEVTNFRQCFRDAANIHPDLFGDWDLSLREAARVMQLVEERIKERMPVCPRYTNKCTT